MYFTLQVMPDENGCVCVNTATLTTANATDVC